MYCTSELNPPLGTSEKSVLQGLNVEYQLIRQYRHVRTDHAIRHRGVTAGQF